MEIFHGRLWFIVDHQKKFDIDTHTETTELKTQLYKMTDLSNNSWLPMVCLRNNSYLLNPNVRSLEKPFNFIGYLKFKSIDLLEIFIM
jgi:hypothetical protein